MINQKNITLVLAALFIISAGSAGYLYKKMDNLKNPDQVAKVEAQKLVAQVGRLMLLPLNEEPTIASVADPSKLSDQPFFINSKEGDKLMIYSQNQKAILFRPSENKIIEVSPINLGNQPNTQKQQNIVNDEPVSTTTKKR